MRTISRSGSGLLLGLAMVLGAPALASAQLFPDLPIRRQRPECSQENPQYKVIRQEYWGYYPTCWRKFPPGWGCPSPEAPNWEKAKKEMKLSPMSAAGGGQKPPRGGDNGDDQPNPDGDKPPMKPIDKPNDPSLPPLNTDPSSPFNIIPDKPPIGTDPKPATDKPETPALPKDAPPAVDAPKPPAASLPRPVGDTPPIASAQPRRRGSLIAGLFTGRRP